MARLARTSSLDRDSGRDVDRNFRFHAPANDRQPFCELSPTIKVHSIHALEGGTHLSSLDRDERGAVGAPSQRIRWPAKDCECSFYALVASPDGMDAWPTAQPRLLKPQTSTTILRYVQSVLPAATPQSATVRRVSSRHPYTNNEQRAAFRPAQPYRPRTRERSPRHGARFECAARSKPSRQIESLQISASPSRPPSSKRSRIRHTAHSRRRKCVTARQHLRRSVLDPHPQKAAGFPARRSQISSPLDTVILSEVADREAIGHAVEESVPANRTSRHAREFSRGLAY
jgi:hypothetical protein